MNPPPDRSRRMLLMVDVLLITAPVGGGKTSVMLEASEILQEHDVAHAAIDIDTLTWCYPRPTHDRFGTRLAMENLRDLWQRYAATGARKLLIARVIESRDALSWYADAIPDSKITVVRLESDTETLQQRLHARETGSSLAWALARSLELSEQMQRNDVADFVIDNNGNSLRDVALNVLRISGWLIKG